MSHAGRGRRHGGVATWKNGDVEAGASGAAGVNNAEATIGTWRARQRGGRARPRGGVRAGMAMSRQVLQARPGSATQRQGWQRGGWRLLGGHIMRRREWLGGRAALGRERPGRLRCRGRGLGVPSTSRASPGTTPLLVPCRPMCPVLRLGPALPFVPCRPDPPRIVLGPCRAGPASGWSGKARPNYQVYQRQRGTASFAGARIRDFTCNTNKLENSRPPIS